jgi:uncharacterized protein YpmB
MVEKQKEVEEKRNWPLFIGIFVVMIVLVGGIAYYFNSQEQDEETDDFFEDLKIRKMTDQVICQNAQNSDLCEGLDIAYGLDYRKLCCSEHTLCC